MIFPGLTYIYDLRKILKGHSELYYKFLIDDI